MYVKIFNDYFAINYRAKNTRNLNLPRDRLSTWGLYYIMILHLNIHACENDQIFRKLFIDYVL